MFARSSRSRFCRRTSPAAIARHLHPRTPGRLRFHRPAAASNGFEIAPGFRRNPIHSCPQSFRNPASLHRWGCVDRIRRSATMSNSTIETPVAQGPESRTERRFLADRAGEADQARDCLDRVPAPAAPRRQGVAGARRPHPARHRAAGAATSTMPRGTAGRSITTRIASIRRSPAEGVARRPIAPSKKFMLCFQPVMEGKHILSSDRRAG